MTQSLVTVVLFVLAILSIPFLLKRWQEKRGGLLPGALAAGSNAKLVSAVAVGPQQRVVTVEVGPEGARTQLVLGVTAQSITCLHTLDVPGPASPFSSSPHGTEAPHA
ncbi:flagellar biosynthetic protein FliO [Comamonadaceae bacterium OTU4NAUVB1]|jgi:flagellar protein FliO/FliZ|nr:flagellar biosynthetic protein FliO [Comamonadaceae bacterium OTU4NAUVB1]